MLLVTFINFIFFVFLLCSGIEVSVDWVKVYFFCEILIYKHSMQLRMNIIITAISMRLCGYARTRILILLSQRWYRLFRFHASVTAGCLAVLMNHIVVCNNESSTKAHKHKHAHNTTYTQVSKHINTHKYTSKNQEHKHISTGTLARTREHISTQAHPPQPRKHTSKCTCMIVYSTLNTKISKTNQDRI